MLRDDDLLRRLEKLPNQSAGYKQLVRELGVHGSDGRRALAQHLAALVASGRLLETARDRYALPTSAAKRENLVSGKLSMHRDGYGFVLPDDPALRDQISGDIYIAPPAVGAAMHGDRVLVEVGPVRADGRAEGRIVRIAERRHAFVVGTFHHGRQGNYVTPIDDKITQVIAIPSGMERPQEDEAARTPLGRSTPHRVIGDEAKPRSYESLEDVVVNVEIIEFPSGARAGKGKVVEVLGYQDDFGVDVEIIIRKHQLPHVFPDEVLEEARTLAADAAGFQREAATRRDFRELPIVTIDGETARDFDDAVMVRRKQNGNYELHVHIADVAHYVTPFTALDEEARLRGTSVYFPARAIPVLTLELSTDLCSLRPQVDRLVMSCIMEIDHAGEVLGYDLHEGVIRSAARMTYTKVHAILEGDVELQKEYAALAPEFERMKELAGILNRKRERRGSIDFDLPEPVIEFDEQGMMQGVSRSERNVAHRLIEEFMLAANECVAEYLERRDIASLYRIHEKPDPKKVYDFELIAASFGYSLGVGAIPVKKIQMRADRREQRRGGRQAKTLELPQEVHITPRMYQKLTEKIAGKPEERIVSYLMLRSLKQARYSEKNEGHFALAAPAYTHFTSPIRRYPDLIIHRLLKAVLRGEVTLDPKIQSRDRIGKHQAASQFAEKHRPEVDPGIYARGKPFKITAPLGSEGKAAEVATPWSKRRPHSGGEHPRRPLIEILPEDELREIAEHASETERAADNAERELMEWKKAQYMAQRIGADYGGLIVSITKFGMFVELLDLFVEGLVPLATMQGDRFTFHENTRQMIGDRWGKIYSIGDRVHVLVDRVDMVAHKINFALIEEAEAKSAPRGAKKKHKKSARPEAAASRAKKKQQRERKPSRPRKKH